MAKYYGIEKGSNIVRTFISKKNRDEWVAVKSGQRRSLTGNEQSLFKSKENALKYR